MSDTFFINVWKVKNGYLVGPFIDVDPRKSSCISDMFVFDSIYKTFDHIRAEMEKEFNDRPNRVDNNKKEE